MKKAVLVAIVAASILSNSCSGLIRAPTLIPPGDMENTEKIVSYYSFYTQPYHNLYSK